ncbi:glycosyltransferase family 39 protein [Geobacter pelophilus]|uniref:Glycosyltransferase family 39 protein n=1 Tax=Geoanaerobacter pelophilus TaxID=60036 RepID=A0AAW4L8N9_9BACT|nr:glycosyltransferase family 39 protein [Geoanaerobacter pelophilus]MBT0664671.1 glycosyltransferase family 39 protein [Geoanaerobacter pelophilus]
MKKFFYIVPIVVAFGIYSVAFNNFFVFDDFIWIHRARTLTQNWSQMFYSEGIYFDPLVYLMFLADSLIAGPDSRWYHAMDLLIHAVNSLLVYRFVNLLSGDEKAGLYGSVLFASSFAIADAVLWPSSRVDLVSVMFSLGTLTLFLKYLRGENSRFLWLACLLFVLALGAKGTPVVVPFILLWFVYAEQKPGDKYLSVAPFGLLVLLYFTLLKIAPNQGVTSFTPGLHLNLRNFSLSLDALFIPERYLEVLNPAITAIVLAVPVIALGLMNFTSESSTRLRRTGVVILAVSLLPVLVLKDFKLATVENPINLLSSPSHRVYLASIGVALIGGGVLRSLEILIKRYSLKGGALATTIILFGVICFNAIEVRERDLLWEGEGDGIRLRLLELLNYRNRIVEDGYVGLSNFPGSRGFLNPMIKAYFNLNKITTEQVQHVGMTFDPEKLKRAERSSFFVMGNDLKLYDLSDQVKNLLLLCRQASLNQARPEYINEINKLTAQINNNIDEILQNNP